MSSSQTDITSSPRIMDCSRMLCPQGEKSRSDKNNLVVMKIFLRQDWGGSEPVHAEDRGGPARHPAEQAGAGAAAGRGQVSCDWSAGANTDV